MSCWGLVGKEWAAVGRVFTRFFTGCNVRVLCLVFATVTNCVNVIMGDLCRGCIGSTAGGTIIGAYIRTMRRVCGSLRNRSGCGGIMRSTSRVLARGNVAVASLRLGVLVRTTINRFGGTFRGTSSAPARWNIAGVMALRGFMATIILRYCATIACFMAPWGPLGVGNFQYFIAVLRAFPVGLWVWENWRGGGTVTSVCACVCEGGPLGIWRCAFENFFLLWVFQTARGPLGGG